MRNGRWGRALSSAEPPAGGQASTESHMTLTFLRRFRSPLIAIVAIVFSATIVLAGQPTGKAHGQANAANHGGKNVASESAEPDESADPDPSAEPDESETD